jgi:myo-inositol-1(or 4)-monophosphatase
MLPDLTTVKNIVISAAEEELMPRFTTRIESDTKADGSFITEADLASQQRIAKELAQLWPEIAFLGEEMEPHTQQALLSSGQALWCLDPLDGTSNFAGNIPFFSVSLALIVDQRIQLGIVYDPVAKECFSAQYGSGAYLNNRPLTASASNISELAKATAIVDFKRLSHEMATRLVTHRPYASQRSFGSVALDWCWIAAGRSHLYLHGKQNLWDYAAGHLILSEAGGFSASLENDPVFQNSLEPRSAVCALDPELFAQWQQWLAE